ncbi:hypothetical protein BT96DRAFT_955562 [Gymnopus androsaceus JB14]|uniref:Uncharacterized protein n=1 Tax=Gymnopus androsaceus JB14 TaxID=1447944 RepID=A0A6A4I2H0_9AGAR|nr:hypothetical protein BT96DRAFT_955562 [Gymnopus androsaceus JB14]
MQSLVFFTVLAGLFSNTLTSPTKTNTAKRATCTVDSVDSASDLSDCTDIEISASEVPAGSMSCSSPDEFTITMTGSVSFAYTTVDGPLWTFDTDDVTFNGNGYSFKGNGDRYRGGVAKPHPFVKFKGYGSFTDFIIKDSPAQAISVGTPLVKELYTLITDILVDNLDGDTDSLGHNTDGFDVSASDVIIYYHTSLLSTLAVAFTFENNYCSGGHGISIGSVSSDKTVSEYVLTVDSDASDATVSSITYSGNSISGNDEYVFLIRLDINFTGSKTTVTTTGDYPVIEVSPFLPNCGKCEGTWDWSELVATGGEASDIVLGGGASISGGTY